MKFNYLKRMKPGLDYDEIFSPVVRQFNKNAFCIISEIKFNCFSLRCKNSLEKNVFMRQPKVLRLRVLKCRLKKAVYGLKQTSKAWNKRVYIKKDNESLKIVALYVDDFIVFKNDKKEIDFLKIYLSRYFKIKDLGEAKQISGVRVRGLY